MATRSRTTTTACQGQRSSSVATAMPAQWSGAKRTTTLSAATLTSTRGSTFSVGLLGHGTVGSAFARLLPEHADRIERITGSRPELAGVVTTSSGSFDELL